MPYKKKTGTKYKRRYRRKAGFSNMTVGQVAQKALAMATSLKGIINAELKHYDESNSVTPTTSGTTFSIVQGLAQGDTNSSINGNSVFVKKIVIRGSAVINASALGTRVRIMVIRDLRPVAGVVAAPSDVLATPINTNSLLNIISGQNRFKVLMDKLIVLDSSSNGEYFFKHFIEQSFHTKFNSTPNPVLNDIFVLALSSEGTFTPNVNIASRIRYYDN